MRYRIKYIFGWQTIVKYEYNIKKKYPTNID